MKTAKKFWRQFAFALVCLLAPLLILFNSSFQRETVLFSNDGPLGAIVATADTAHKAFTGFWQPLNWIGTEQPSALPNVTMALFFLLGDPVVFAKWYAPLSLLLLGIAAWFFFRKLGLPRALPIIGALGVALNTGPFSYACWGLPPITISIAAIFAALAVLTPLRPGKTWVQLCLAGFFVGLAIMEGYDVGAILSLFVAAFVVFQAWTAEGSAGRKLLKGSIRVAVVAMCAAFISAHALATLIGTQVKGIAGAQQDATTRDQRWDEATMWSLPKIETLRVIIPGLFGYRMDTPEGGNYWGAVGQQPGVPQSRHSGSGVYAGVLVVLLAIWAVARSLYGRDSPFTRQERRFIWFWAGAALVSLLLAYGRHAPLYQLLYQLPYFSTIRNPIKFMHPFSIAVVILFGYGLAGMWRRYLQGDLPKAGSLLAQIKAWWPAAPVFDKKWVISSSIALGASVLGWLLYAASRADLIRYMEFSGFPRELASKMASFSIAESGWFVLFFAWAVGTIVLIVSGGLSGPRAKWAGVLLGALLVLDLGRANTPWIIYYNYKEKYATNPVIELLRERPFERRVAARLAPMSRNYLASNEGHTLVAGMSEEWLQHHFQFYRIQSLDIVQMPRKPELDLAFMMALAPQGSHNLFPIGRLWQLTSTRYIVGMTGFLDLLNQQIDPLHQSFRVHTPFDFIPRHSAATATRAEDITAAIHPEGNFAIFEFGAALPRAQLFTEWQVLEDDHAALQRLADPAFDPRRTVLVAGSAPVPAADSGQITGTASITHYEPKRIRLQADTQSPAVLLLNDKYDPNWQVTVNGQRAPLLRCNHIMRGVYLDPGQHQVEFRFEPPHWTLHVSLAGIGLGIILCGFLAAGAKRGTENPADEAEPAVEHKGKTRPQKMKG
jgi:hypothetical protein